MRIEILDAMLIALLGGALLAPPAHAQDVSGGLRGRVFGGDDPLSQATVEVSGPSLPQPIAVQSDAHGQFRFLSLPVGTYELRLRVVGYRPTRYEGVPVTLGRATDLGRIRLEPFAIEVPELTVRADPVSLDPTSTTTGATLGADQFDALPLDRSFRSVAALAPQATYQQPYLAYGSEGVNIAGGSVWDNAYFVDGVDVTDPFVGSSGTNLPYNFLQAVEVKTGGYEAEYGRALGGVVNMVTPTGGNRFEGQVFTFLSDHRLRTAAIYGNNEPNLDTFTQFDIGIALSGPIRKDRAWFYASYNPIVDDRTASFPGMDPTRDRMRQYRFAGKLTWQPRPVTRLSVTFTGDPSWHDAVAPGGSQAPISVLNPDVVLGRLLDGGGSLSFSASHVVHSRLLLEASASRSLFRRDQLPQTDLGASTPYFLDVSSGVASGGFGGSERFHLGRTALRLSGTRLAGPHSLKVGLEYENTALSSRANEGRDQVGGYIYYLADRGLYIWDRLQNQSDCRQPHLHRVRRGLLGHLALAPAQCRPSLGGTGLAGSEASDAPDDCRRVVSPAGADRHARLGGSPKDLRQRGPLLRAGTSRCTLGLLRNRVLRQDLLSPRSSSRSQWCRYGSEPAGGGGRASAWASGRVPGRSQLGVRAPSGARNLGGGPRNLSGAARRDRGYPDLRRHRRRRQSRARPVA
jgi:Outer membrane receptor proteins, mostly Fe transport